MSTVKSKGQTESWLMGILEQIFPNIICTASDLKHPSKDFVLGYYTEFLTNLGVNTEAFCQASPSMNEKFGDTYILLKLSIVLKDVLNKIMCDEISPPFGLMDLLQPSPGRTAAFLTSMANFLCYAINKLAVIDEYVEELEIKKNNYDDLLLEQEALRQKLNEEANDRARLSDLQAEVVNKQQVLTSLAVEEEEAEKITAEKEKTLQDAESKLEGLNKNLASAQEEVAKMEALVVRSPLSVKTQKIELEQKSVETEESINVAKDMLTSKKEILKKFDTVGEELNSNISLLEKVIAESKQISCDKELAEELQRKLLKAREEEGENNEERQKVREKLAQLQETESGLLLRNETKNKEFQERIKVLKREFDDIIKQKSEEKILQQNAVGKGNEKYMRFAETFTTLCKIYEEKYAALLLKEKSVGDVAQNELEEAIFKIQKHL